VTMKQHLAVPSPTLASESPAQRAHAALGTKPACMLTPIPRNSGGYQFLGRNIECGWQRESSVTSLVQLVMV